MQTTSFKLSKELNKLGIKQDSLLWWMRDSIDLSGKEAKEHYSLTGVIHNVENLATKKYAYPAYALDEMLEMLPRCLCSHHIAYYLNIEKEPHDNGYKCTYYEGLDSYDPIHNGFETLNISPINKNPAEAAGLLLVWCIENSYVKPEELNNEMA